MPAPGQPNLHIIARLLGRLAEPRTWTRSSLQRAVRLNYDLFSKYLDILVERGLAEIAAAKGSDRVSITERGQQTQRELLDWLENLFGGEI